MHGCMITTVSRRFNHWAHYGRASLIYSNSYLYSNCSMRYCVSCYKRLYSYVYTSMRNNNNVYRQSNKIKLHGSIFGIAGYCLFVPASIVFLSLGLTHTIRTSHCEKIHQKIPTIENFKSHDLFKEKYNNQRKKRISLLAHSLQLLWDFLSYMGRCVHITCVFMPIMCVYPLLAFNEYTHHKWLCIVRASFEHLGSTFIKLGQWTATRRDLFSSELCAVFSRLHNTTHLHSWTLTKKRLRHAFGPRWRDLIVYINKKPVGSGCIAQVYQAYMRSDLIPDDFVLHDDNDHAKFDFIDGECDVSTSQ